MTLVHAHTIHLVFLITHREGDKVKMPVQRSYHSLLEPTKEVRERLGQGFDDRGLRKRYMDETAKISRAYDMALYLHPPFAGLDYVEQIITFYGGGPGMYSHMSRYTHA